MNEEEFGAGYTGESHPEIFENLPPQPNPLKPGQLSADEVKQFYQEGFVVVKNFFKPEELEPSKQALSKLVDELAHKLYDAGKVNDLYENFDFENRLTMLDKDFPGAHVVMYKKECLLEEISDLWSDEKLVNVAEQLLGTADIDGTPSWNFRPKLPKDEITVIPWHQDAAYFDNSTYKSLVVSAWIPLVDATVKNGCLQVARYGHRLAKVAKHTGCFEDSWYIMLDEEEMASSLGVGLKKDVVTCEVPLGGVLFFTSFTPHKGLPNMSDSIRWSFDFRWQAAGLPPGYYGMKESVRMRSSTDPDMKIDWTKFKSVDRRALHYKLLNSEQSEFNTTNPGPWMVKWPMSSPNRHSLAMKADLETWKSMIAGEKIK